MKKVVAVIIFLCSSVVVFAQPNIACIIKTSLGNITLSLNAKQAPETVANFLYYVDKHLYDSTYFFRVCTPQNEAARKIKIEVIQGGDIAAAKLQKPFALETTKQTGLLHKNGMVSMARDTPNSAQASFFICINNQPELDFAGRRNPDGQGFAAFGRVTDGMEVVKKIQQQKENKQQLLQPVIIYSVSRGDQ